MTIKQLHSKYTDTELSIFPGDNQLRYEAFSPLLSNLFENKVVYHERFTGIIKLEEVIITPERFHAKAIPYLLIEKGNRFDQYFFSRQWEFGAVWSHIWLNGNRLGSPYANWMIWCEPDLVKEVEAFTLNKNFDGALNLTLLNKG